MQINYMLIIFIAWIFIIAGKTVFDYRKRKGIDINRIALITSASILLLLLSGEVLEHPIYKPLIIVLLTPIYIYTFSKAFQKDRIIYGISDDTTSKSLSYLLFVGFCGLASLLVLASLLDIFKISPMWAVYVAIMSTISIVTAFIGQIIFISYKQRK